MRNAIEKFDHWATLAIAKRRRPFWVAFFRILTFTGDGRWWTALLILFGFGIGFGWLPLPRHWFVFYATLAPAVSWILVKAMKLIWRRRRPYQVLPGFPVAASLPSDESFPSGHTASVFAFLLAMSPLGSVVAIPLAIWATLVSFSRLYLGVHFPSDVLVGAIVGSLAGAGFGGAMTHYAGTSASVTRAIASPLAADKYASYTELARHEREGQDFTVETRDGTSKILVLAIHGENIEPGSDDVAEAIAGSDHRKYIFRAHSYDHYLDLHVTSTHFDDPRALDLAGRSRLCLSVHGYRATGESICMGGGNSEARAGVETAIRRTFPSIEIDSRCAGLDGVDPANIVNRCADRGVQLELSKPLRDRLVAEPAARADFARTVRGAVQFFR